jgi:hypothetical protein
LGDLIVAAILCQRSETFRVPHVNFDFANISHMDLGDRARFCQQREWVCGKATVSPRLLWRTKRDIPFECSNLAAEKD